MATVPSSARTNLGGGGLFQSCVHCVKTVETYGRAASHVINIVRSIQSL